MIAQVRKTTELLGAMSRLRARAQQRGLVEVTGVRPDDWVFHLSVAYCSKLSDTSWGAACRFVDDLAVPAAQQIASGAEIVVFDDEQESSGGVVPLTGAAN